jgi:CBS domain containing-hemolysin-like protein
MSEVVIIVLSLLLSAFFSGMEIAFVSSNKLRFELDRKTKSPSFLFLNVLFKNPQQFLSTLLVGNNIMLVIYGLQMAKLLAEPLSYISPNAAFVTISQTVISTIIVLVTGEFLPKTIFRVNPNLWLRIFAFPLWFFYILLYPAATFTTALAIGILRLFGVKQAGKVSPKSFNRTDLDYWVQESVVNSDENEEIGNEVKIFQNALEFSNVKLKDCMVPRPEIIALSENATIEELKETFIEKGLSRIIIYKENIDNVIGSIHIAEMFKDAEHWKQHINPLPIAAEIMPASKLLAQLMQQRKSMAMVVDEFGGTAGIVTMEDIMEEIFGEIEDEHDSNSLISQKLKDNEYLLSGRLEIDSVNHQYDLDIPESDSYVTVAGFILHHYQDFPKLNEVIKIDKFSFRILRVTNNKIELVNLKIA